MLFASARGALAASVATLAPDGHVGVPAYTCVAVPNAVRSGGGVVRSIDVNGLGQLTQTTPPDLNALIVQDTYGFPATIPRDVVVIRDASHRVDLVRDRSGTAVTVTSLEHSKWLSAGRGGLAVAENAHVAASLRDWRDDHRHEHRLLPIAAFTGVGMLSGRLLFGDGAL